MNDDTIALTVTLAILVAIVVVIVAIIWGVVKIFGGARAKRKYQKEVKELQTLKEKYGEVERLSETKIDIQKDISSLQRQVSELKIEESSRSKALKEILSQIEIYKDDLDFIDVGILPAEFELDASEDYKTAIIEAKNKQKAMVKNKTACVCLTNWSVDGNERKGRAMTNQQIKMTLRSFNNECDVAIAAVKWNNLEKTAERIAKSFNAINKFNEKQTIVMPTDYLQLKIDELHATHQYRLKLHQEKEEQREIRQQMREEEKARREIEKALKAAEKEEKLLQEAMKKARAELADANEAQKQKFQLQLQTLEEKLKEAEEKGQRALSMAQQTKRGHVYIISNIGSFGENVYKIGMTRRLEPFDRVKELGDASVPFPFDVHAMIFSDNAPALEKALHRHFDVQSVNKVNPRKEFFNISIKELRDFVEDSDIESDEVRWTMAAEAEEYRQSLAIEKQQKKIA